MSLYNTKLARNKIRRLGENSIQYLMSSLEMTPTSIPIAPPEKNSPSKRQRTFEVETGVNKKEKGGETILRTPTSSSTKTTTTFEVETEVNKNEKDGETILRAPTSSSTKITNTFGTTKRATTPTSFTSTTTPEHTKTQTPSRDTFNIKRKDLPPVEGSGDNTRSSCWAENNGKADRGLSKLKTPNPFGFTHICVCARDPKEVNARTEFGDQMLCGFLMSCIPRKGGGYHTTQALAHLNSHPIVASGKQQSSLDRTFINPIQLDPKDACALGILQWVIYSKQHISLRSLDDPYFRAMLSNFTMLGNLTGVKGPIVNAKNVKDLIGTEHELFYSYFKSCVEDNHKLYKGAPFMFLAHDGGTTANQIKMQVLACQFIDLRGGVPKQTVITFAFKGDIQHGGKGESERIAQEFIIIIMKLCGIEDHLQLFHGSVQDKAAASTATHMGFEILDCLMHNVDKVSRSAIGALTKSAKGVVLNNFPEANLLIAKIRNTLKVFRFGGDKLAKLKEISRVLHGPEIKPQIDLCDTRVAAYQTMLMSAIKLGKALIAFRWEKKDKPKLNGEDASLNAKDIEEACELESVLNVIGRVSTLSQVEKHAAAAFRTPLLEELWCDLKNGTLRVVEYEAVTALEVPRKRMELESEVGKETLSRALLEFERRFVADGVLKSTNGSKLASFLDLRTNPFFFDELNPEQMKADMELIKRGYEKFVGFILEKEYPVVAAKADSTTKVAMDSSISAVMDLLGGDSEDDDDGPIDTVATKLAAIMKKFKSHLKKFMEKAKGMDYDARFPTEMKEIRCGFRSKTASIVSTTSPNSDETPVEVFEVDDDYNEIADEEEIGVGNISDLPLSCLIKIPIANVYLEMGEDEYGYFPLFALSVIGSLNSEGICERVLSIANRVCDDGNTRFKASTVEPLVLLRANREFMNGEKKRRGVSMFGNKNK